MSRTYACAECAKPFSLARDHEQMFCCTACRTAFNNRRKNRGAELYDLFMTMRFDRDTAKVNGVWAVMCRMASEWNEEDRMAFTSAEEAAAGIKKPGRRSFGPVRKVLERFTKYRAVRYNINRL